MRHGCTRIEARSRRRSASRRRHIMFGGKGHVGCMPWVQWVQWVQQWMQWVQWVRRRNHVGAEIQGGKKR